MNKQQGFSSVEMLISTAITLLLLSGTMSALNGSFGHSKKAVMMSDLEQNLRAGMNLIVRDFINAGWGIPVGGIPIPSGEGAQTVYRPGPPGKTYVFTTNTINAVNPGAGMGPSSGGESSDIVSILFADSSLPLNQSPLASIAADGSMVTVNANTPILGANAIRPGDLVFLNNAKGKTMLCVTRIEGQKMYFDTTDSFRLNQRAASEGSILQLANDDGTFPPTTATRVYLATFYLDFTTDPNTPRLMRRINFGDGAPVALILDNFQLTYDLVDGISNPTKIDTPVDPNSPNQIRKANILISGRSAAKMDNSDDYLRRSLTTQVSLRSLSFVDRYR
jgi:type II secretory pathway pseudopilin PulG